MISAANFFLSLIAVLCFGLGIGYLLGQKCQKDSKADSIDEPCPEEVEPATPEEIEAARSIVRQQGGCQGVDCFVCPIAVSCRGATITGPSRIDKAAAVAWLNTRGLSIKQKEGEQE